MTDTSSMMETARKRKRVELDVPDTGARSFVHEARSSSDFSVSTASKDVLEISDANPEAKFIKISNTSADKVSHSFSGCFYSCVAALFASIVCEEDALIHSKRKSDQHVVIVSFSLLWWLRSVQHDNSLFIYRILVLCYTCVFMAAVCNKAGHYIFALWILSFSIYLSFIPRLISVAADWMSTILRHMVWP